MPVLGNERVWEADTLGEPIGTPAGVAAPARVGWNAWALPLTLVVLALALILPRLDAPDEYVFDELYYAFTAGKYVAGSANAYRCCRPPRETTAIEWTHPPLAKLLIAGGILGFGDNPVGWRVASVCFGVLGVVVTFLLGKTLSGSQAVGALAALLLLCDGLFFVESRTGMSNLFLLVFTNAALLACARVLTMPLARASTPLLATGTFLGLAIATKWSAVALLGLVGVAYGWRIMREWRATRFVPVQAIARGVAALVAVPAAIYLLSYSHFFLTGHRWEAFLALHASMLEYHRELGIVHAYSSSWWEWPLAARPVWYYASPRGEEGAFVFANGNPLLYWPMVLAVAWVAIDWWGRRPAALTILAIGFFGQWLPWALSPRGTFIYHFLPAVPLGCIALGILLSGAWEAGGWRRGAAGAYLLAVVAVFVFFYPLYTAMPLSPDQVAARMWFGSWR